MQARFGFGWQLVTPVFLLVSALLVLPLAFSFYVSLHRWNLTVIPNVLRFVGWTNYQSILSNRATWDVIGFTRSYTAASVAGELLVGLCLALLLDRVPRGSGHLRRAAGPAHDDGPDCHGPRLAPAPQPRIRPDQPPVGIRGRRLARRHHAGEVQRDPGDDLAGGAVHDGADPGAVCARCRASLSRPPSSTARTGGRSSSTSRLPMLKSVILIAVLIRFIFEFRAFDIIWILTSGGPAGATETLSLLNFRMTFQNFAIGPGAALSWVMLTLTAFIVVGYVIALRGRARRRRREWRSASPWEPRNMGVAVFVTLPSRRPSPCFRST